MKKTITAIAVLLAMAGASAQTADSNSGSNSNAGANSGSVSGVQSSNSGNTTAIGNQNASRSDSASQSGAQSGSLSGAVGNNVVFNTPSSQTINNNLSGTTTQNSNSTNSTTLNGNSTENIKYSGTIENKTSGGTTNYDRTDVHYSGSQTIKNVPGIAMSGPASGPCTGASGGLGVAGPGFGVGLNGAKVDDGCTVRENTRVLGQLYQSLESTNPAKQEAAAALLEGMAIIRNMNAKIGGGYAPAPAPKVAEAPAAVPLVTAKAGEPTDPYIRARMGLK